MLTKDTAVITFKSNSDYSDADTAVIAGVMRRAAELTLEQGYSGFMVLKDGGQSSHKYRGKYNRTKPAALFR